MLEIQQLRRCLRCVGKGTVADTERQAYIARVYLSLDNDEIGQKAAQRISNTLMEKSICNRILAPSRKDWNEDLLFLRKEEAR